MYQEIYSNIAALAVAGMVFASVGGAASAEEVFAVTSSQTLVSFDSNNASTINSGVAISGLAQNEQIRGIDFRPANGQLYAMGSFSNLYVIDTASGAASLVGAGSFAPSLNGSSFGFDFNPVIDRIRVVSDADQNLVLNPDNGTATQVTDLFYQGGDANFGVNPNVVGSAYTNAVAGATSTQLYGIDAGLDTLVTQANSAGTLATVGSLGVNVNDTLSFDISGVTGLAFASVQSDDLSRSTFWMINLSDGSAVGLGEIGGGALITSIAVVPAPHSGLVFIGLAALGRRRR